MVSTGGRWSEFNRRGCLGLELSSSCPIRTYTLMSLALLDMPVYTRATSKQPVSVHADEPIASSVARPLFTPFVHTACRPWTSAASS